MYGKPDYLADGAQADVDTVELDILEITDQAKLTNSQLNAYIRRTMGTHTSIEIRYYVKAVVGGTYHELPYRNESDGAITSVPTKITSSTPEYFVDSLPLPACVAFKATAKGVGGANGAIEMMLMGRDN